MESTTDTVQSATEEVLTRLNKLRANPYTLDGAFIREVARDAFRELTRAREREKELVEALASLAFHAAAMRKKLANANLPTGYADHEAIRDAERLLTARALAGGKP